jgi:excinuclease ABC subunit C
VKEDLARQMEEAAEVLDFERAATLPRPHPGDELRHPDAGHQSAIVEEADVFGLAQEGGQTCIQVFFFRSWQNWGNRAYYPKADRSLEAPEILAAFLAQFYDDKPVPDAGAALPRYRGTRASREALSTHAGRKDRGGRAAAGREEDARRACRHQCARGAGAEDRGILLPGEAAGRRAARFRAGRAPRRIEVYDNSHIQGTNPVGAMIVAGPDGFIKSQYRKFNIRSEEIGSDDFAMMREVLTRRFSRLPEGAGRGAGMKEQAKDVPHGRTLC